MTNKGKRLKRADERFNRAPDRLPSGDSWRAQLPSGSSTARGYGARWQRERLEFLDANPLCERCHKRGTVEAASVVNHRRPHHGDAVLFWDRTNWEATCQPCHDSTIQSEEWRMAYGRNV